MSRVDFLTECEKCNALLSGAANGRRAATPPNVTIHQPAPQATISGGLSTVSGFGRATFEQTLVVEVQDK
jgi:hypothetical protein